MSVDESEIRALINEAQAWRDAMAACAPGSPERLRVPEQNEKGGVEMHALGPPQYPPGIGVEINIPEQSEE
jgi:hypothetical protein